LGAKNGFPIIIFTTKSALSELRERFTLLWIQVPN